MAGYTSGHGVKSLVHPQRLGKAQNSEVNILVILGCMLCLQSLILPDRIHPCYG